MCGVFGYVGQPTPVVPLVANALRIMEYRGYDSWGIGWDAGSRVELLKQTGRVPHQLRHEASASIAIGHTRWATHGGVTDENAHPHSDATNQIAVVHNGVIENAASLKSTLLSQVTFRSETDSEIVPHLIRGILDRGGTFAEAVKQAFLLLEGSSAIVAMDRASEMLIAITARSPLRLGRRADGWELASDPLACAGTSKEIAIIPDHHLVILTRNSAQIIDIHQGTDVAIRWEPTPEEIHTTRGAFPHFTIKEIHDQADVLRTLAMHTNEAEPLAEAIRRHQHIILTGCGSAFYAASVGAGWLRSSTDAWIDIVPASEIATDTRNRGKDTLVIAFTQSGETADVVDAIQIARSWGSSIGTVINTETSTVARMADIVLPIHAGVERSVLATKSFMAMAVRLYQVSELLAGKKVADLSSTATNIESILANRSIEQIASRIANAQSMVVLGKDTGRTIAQEAALKIKEGSYLHAEAFLTGELKHGPLALIERGTPCIIFATSDQEMDSARLAATEVASRGGFVVGVGPWDESACHAVISIGAGTELSSFEHLVTAQKLAYHIALQRGVDPDFPRNLAKSVTVR